MWMFKDIDMHKGQTSQSFQSDPNMKTYDEYGMYPAQNRSDRDGDLHGDLRVTLMALRLAGVISNDIYHHNVSEDIKWIGGQTYMSFNWVIKLIDVDQVIGSKIA